LVLYATLEAPRLARARRGRRLCAPSGACGDHGSRQPEGEQQKASRRRAACRGSGLDHLTRLTTPAGQVTGQSHHHHQEIEHCSRECHQEIAPSAYPGEEIDYAICGGTAGGRTCHGTCFDKHRAGVKPEHSARQDIAKKVRESPRIAGKNKKRSPASAPAAVRRRL